MNKIFKAAQWYYDVTSMMNFYREINNFISSPTVLAVYLKSLQVMTATEEGERVVEDESIKRPFIENATTNIKDAAKFYNRQMLVVASTYIEMIQKNFIAVLFANHPERMYEYLYPEGRENDKGVVSLKEVIKSASKDALINQLSEQAMANAVKGRINASMNNLSKIAAEKIPDQLKKKLIEIVVCRNRVVHEASQEVIRSEDVIDALDTCHEFIEYLVSVSSTNKIEIDNYTPFDDREPPMYESPMS
ncbi:MAG TPA: hypothetical protein VF586_05770 [Pyrinomonadaceae bacterium]|jgi:hypothetical protein